MRDIASLDRLQPVFLFVGKLQCRALRQLQQIVNELSVLHGLFHAVIIRVIAGLDLLHIGGHTGLMCEQLIYLILCDLLVFFMLNGHIRPS